MGVMSLTGFVSFWVWVCQLDGENNKKNKWGLGTNKNKGDARENQGAFQSIHYLFEEYWAFPRY